jgi:DNA-binding CsgD family transcriptional regulator
VLQGRASERAVIDGLLERARAGSGGGLVLHGEPGIGKTALLEYAAEEAHGMRVLRTAGVEPESDLGYATLHRLLVPVLDRLDQLPEPQAESLRVVFGQASGPAPDRFLVALATLSLLSEAGRRQPVLCLVDDAHWADSSSLDTFTFVARRLEAEPIAVAMAVRADEGRLVDVTGLTDLRLAGLDRDAVRALLAELRGGSPYADHLDDLLHATAGNPLAIRELPAAARSDAGHREPVPLAAGLRHAFLERVRRRSPAAQLLLLLIAADGSGRTATIGRAAGALESDAGPVARGELDDLIIDDGTTLAFRHPLIRSAVYHGATPADRRAAHRALAKALESEYTELDRRAWHLGQAADGPDETVAGELERSAEQALRRAGPAAAAAALVQAAKLSVSEPYRARRSVAAAAAWWHGGYAERAVDLLEEAERLPHADESVRIDCAVTRAHIELRAGTPSDAVARLRPVIHHTSKVDRHRAVQLLMLLGEAGFSANVAEAWTEMAAAAQRLARPGNDADDVFIRLILAVCRARAGADPDLQAGDLDVVEQLTDPARLGWAGGMAWGMGNRALARRLHRRAELLARTSGAIGTLAWVLNSLVADELTRGRFASAEAFAEEGHRFAVESGQPNTACRHQSSLAVLAAICGREEQARSLAESVLAEAGQRGLAGSVVSAHRALALLCLVAGRPAEAFEHLEALIRDGRTTHPGLTLIVVPELVEAAVRAGLLERAREPLDRFLTSAEAAQAPDRRALAARCRALVAVGNAADAQFHLALKLHSQAEHPMEYARTELLYGQHLRRERRRSDARPHLRAAGHVFRRLGATPWADLADDELRATGETTRRTEPNALMTLTPQERRIATAVGQGSTNREIAAQLFLSPRTVDYHLRKVFQKLGIGSRAELIRYPLATDEDIPTW